MQGAGAYMSSCAFVVSVIAFAAEGVADLRPNLLLYCNVRADTHLCNLVKVLWASKVSCLPLALKKYTYIEIWSA